MAQMGRPGLSDSQKRELWNMWVAGCSISEISRVLERKPGSIFGVLAARRFDNPSRTTSRTACCLNSSS